MATEKRLIRLDDLMKFPIRIDHCDKEHGDVNFVYGIETVLEYAEYLPAVDAVEIVRCRDCIYRHTRYNCQGRQMDFFCADGKRMGGFWDG